MQQSILRTHTSAKAKEMDGVQGELNEVKAQNKHLEEECRRKTDLYESLRKAHNEILPKLQDAKLLAEKQAQELYAKSEEISELSKLSKDLKYSLNEKELCLRHLSSANEKLRSDYGHRIDKLEGGNNELALALDEARFRIKELESKVSAGNQEAESLKKLLSLTDKKSLETKENMKKSIELEQSNEIIQKLEEEHRRFQDQLKWKNEKFQHLEEAHARNQERFRSSKEEWEKDKSALVEEICSLQASLDSQTRISESLQAQLTMCNQALAHEESKRKMLEVEASKYKLHFENVAAECQEAKLQIDSLALKRDEEVGKLRNALATKATVFKEMEYKLAQLDHENQELRGSLREFQEAQISNTGTNALLKKLQKKIQGLEQLHKKSSVNLKDKEIEWNHQMEKVTADMNAHLFELKCKNEQIQELQEELKSNRCLVEMYHAVFEMEWCKKESAEKILLLTEQLELKNHAIHKVEADSCKKCDEAAFLMEKIQLFDHMKQQHTFVQKELEKHKKMHAESSECQVFLKEQVQQLESALKQDTCKDASGALEKMNLELAKKIHEVDRAESDTKKWESMADNLKVYLEENLDSCSREKENLLGILKEKDEIVECLQQQLVLLESVLEERTARMEALELEKEYFLQETQDKNISIQQFLKEIDYLKQESARRESVALNLAKLNAHKVFEHEKASLLQAIEEKEQMIKDLQEQANSLKQDITNAVISSEEKQTEIDELRESFLEEDNLKNLEIEEKNMIIAKLETEITDLQEGLLLKEELLSQSNQQAKELHALLQANKLETEKLMDEFAKERRHSEDLVKKLVCEKGAVLDDITKLSLDREDVLNQMEGMCEQISEFSAKDCELALLLGKILQKPEGKAAAVYTPISPSLKTIDESAGMRSPLVELNK